MIASATPVAQLSGIMQVTPDAALVQANDRLSVARWRHNEPYASNGVVSEHMLVMPFADCAQRRRLTATCDASTRAGSLTTLQKGEIGEWEYDGPVDILHVYLGNRFLNYCLRQHDMDARDVDMADNFGFEDPFLREAMSDIDRALAVGRSASLYISTLGLAIGLRVLTKYSRIDLAAPRVFKGALAPHQLRKAQDYIDANLVGDATLDDIAQVTGLSSKHFARAFQRSTGVPPHRWLLQRRIERARNLLATGGLPLAEIALVCGFADQSHLTVAFRKMTGMTPGAFRRAARL